MSANLARLLAPLRTRIANLLARGVVRLVDDAGGLQAVQLGVLAGETRDGAERFQEYGFSARPHPGAEAVVLFVGGRRDHPVVVAVDDRRHRKRGLAAGETCLYTDEGDYVLLKRGRIVEVKAGTKLRVDAPAAEFTGTVTATGAVSGASYKVAGTQVVGAQQPAIPDPAGGGTVDAAARGTLVALLQALRAHGLIA